MNASLRALRRGYVRIGEHLRRSVAAYGVLLISLLLTALAYYYVRQNVEAQNRLRFDEATQATQEAIERRIKAYLDAHNRKPKPFVWTASADRILQKTAKLCKSLG